MNVKRSSLATTTLSHQGAFFYYKKLIHTFLCVTKQYLAFYLSYRKYNSTLCRMRHFPSCFQPFAERRQPLRSFGISDRIFDRFRIADQYQSLLCPGNCSVKKIANQHHRMIISYHHNHNRVLTSLTLMDSDSVCML